MSIQGYFDLSTELLRAQLKIALRYFIELIIVSELLGSKTYRIIYFI